MTLKLHDLHEPLVRGGTRHFHAGGLKLVPEAHIEFVSVSVPLENNILIVGLVARLPGFSLHS